MIAERWLYYEIPEEIWMCIEKKLLCIIICYLYDIMILKKKNHERIVIISVFFKIRINRL